MTQISSRITWGFKWLPAAICLASGAGIGSTIQYLYPGDWPLAVLVLAGGGLFAWVFRVSCLHVADRVHDDGDRLLVRLRGYEGEIPLRDIISVNFGHSHGLQFFAVITLRLHAGTGFGDEVTFIPPLRWISTQELSIIDSLIARRNLLLQSQTP